MPSRRSNRSELDDLSAAQRTAVSEGAQALDHLTGRASFNAWMQVARGIVPLCALADKPGRSRSARRSLFKEAGYGSLSRANISRLLHMGRFESQIVIWRMGLKPRQRETWNSPATICKRCPEVRKAIEEANKNRPPRLPRPRPVVDPADELERAINRVFNLLDEVKDIDLRRQQIERLTTLLSELSEEEPKPTKAVKATKPEREPASKPKPRKPKMAKAVKAAKPEPEQAKDGALKWRGTPGSRGIVTATVSGGEEYAIDRSFLFDIFGDGSLKDNFSVYLGRADVPVRDRRKIGAAATFDKAKDIAERHAAARG
jgi:hypothetical protein